ncbi:hypothetical protein [Streptomyces sp. NPDC057438]|uniref:hypothetical protein n=1 Tax=Streptomyces sp. NPDC057438 TaxID=3346133 RepID=UPI00367D13D2
MSKTEHEASSQRLLVCPVCKQRLEMTIKSRHKTLGVFVPVWGPSPCHNPDCPKHLEKPETDQAHAT